MLYRGNPDWSTKIISNSRALCGYSTDEFNSQEVNWSNIIHPDDKKRVFDETAKIKEKQSSLVQTYRIITKNGKIRWVNDHKTSFFGKDGSFIGVDGAVFDVTRQKVAKKLLKQSEAQYQRNYDIQNVLYEILNLSADNISIDNILKCTLDLLLSISWLSFQEKGSIFLVDDDPEILILKTHKNFEESLIKTCSRLPFDKCHCGKAALTKEIQFADHIDHTHEIQYENMLPHGHYCVPILYENNTIGVINLYVPEGHHRDENEEIFLVQVANTLAGIVMRKRTEDELRTSEANLAEAQRIAHLGNWHWDITNNKLQWSDEVFRIFGVQRHEIDETYEAFLGFVHSDDRCFIKQSVEKALYEKKPYSIDHRIVLPDGSERIVH